MADLAEILMIEHMAIRHIRNKVERKPDYQMLDEFHDYLKRCHIEIEEKILFPILLDNPSESDPGFKEEAKRIMADHKLIQALFENLARWSERQDIANFKSRFPLYFRLLQEHNDKEDASVFPHWKSIGVRELKSAKLEASSVIESFGRKRYLEVTGLSEDSYAYIIK